MKKSILYLLLFVSLGVTFLSCDDTDDIQDPNYIPTSYIKVDGVYYKLSQGFFDYNGANGTSNLFLVGDSVTCDTFYGEFTGSSPGVVITFSNPNISSQLVAANYVYNESGTGSNVYSSFKFSFYQNWATSFTNYNLDVNHNAVGVTKSGTTYTITFNGKDNFNNPYELKYVGKISSFL